MRELTELADLRRCERVQRTVWGGDELEVTAASQLKAAVHAGALVAGAFEGDELLGFVFSFPSYTRCGDGWRVGQHSHLLAVRPEARGRGIGRQLKWFQRAWCLARGVTHVTWTFDPLQARNARLNLEHLGAYATRYYPDFYGPLGGLNGTGPSDRLLAEWPLTAPHVAALAAGEARAAPPTAVATGLELDPEGRPLVHRVPADAQAVRLEVPARVDLRGGDPLTLTWRLALREVMQPLLARGLRATRFFRGGYLLEAAAHAPDA
ncbi:GNAT family N-acetyltransferase [Truepera radiovictrix]|uniref:GNAT family N-acetyltransferase n=1 Tax=Truepera radiovictrix TaxID=332249 RepID=UPI0016201016|nr:GNAT family N-acetyltransferase [Truepera radiovictrix]WMT56210.1 GNAT family N-acetyltransferase [Truepera radiovictrix]